ncbi:O-succinylhomoserine sulfhydrylase [Alloalcanivorax xenomutans]|jgi:O-succinylhomoserine sulfhydrylase|uniref:O-succinylhomoserine sulfhydrylase n=1 Tax=Alloalcanivorax xenomutans TaxID=1094342 RepID=UPI0003B7ECAC|nr:O-succinylhomoserine sulfhydrylase [Alloalcanivorax xenomutans]ERS12981.1 O-succinylhomoserine sulfhydrylase [Alcanivorax sp. PN-3]MBA4723233.1 O-succinylhomoserine sulfhydrylase [Alcanivorax sp.]PHS55606.1 MAG: O-succinylhomoserine sulfhydrylase [Alcanivorax sp.]WOA29794.1 O-succinylhomoserine sulfhydrylase [Alloalcanivorax xenomutans]CUR46409.1 O-acetylhomoserine sulfhydrylase / O-succinylhomoserine sulfhydrylase [Alloalcanivorax xenomutans]|tara:strand:+ start:782 stop:1993 length:1212 start_codon:yes stop_codon:yes gene_type:complete
MSDFSDPNELHTDTLAIRWAQLRTDQMSHSEPLFLTSSFVYDSAAQAAARFSGEEPGNVYSRFTNPTVAAFEQRLAAMEGAEKGVALASGMAAISSTFLALLAPGDHIVSSRSVFGTTNVVFDRYLKKFQVETTMVDLADLEQWRAAIRPETKVLFLETPSNPLSEVGDIPALAKLAHDNGAILIVDNCFCTPALQKPLALGADLVIHSATKYLDGQGRCLGGAVVGPAKLVDEVHGFVRSAGPSMSPFNAWVFLKGLETLGIRMEAHSRNTLALAEWLEQQPGIARVHYAGLKSHPQHELAARQQSGFGAVLAIEVEDSDGNRDRQAAWRFIDGTRLISITANLGDTKSTITHPGSTTHGRVAEEDKQRAGITENLIRIAVGLEDLADLKADLSLGLKTLGF